MATGIYEQVNSNRWKTWLLMILFTAFIVGVVYIFAAAYGWGLGTVGFALIVAGVINFIGYYFSSDLAIATSGAHEVTKSEEPDLYRSVENMTIASGLPMPKVYVIEDPAPNAFATGRDPKHAAVVFTRGLLERLNHLELEGVVAHELSHVKNYDTRLMSIVVVLVGTLVLLADIFTNMMWFRGGDREERGGAGGIFLIIGLLLAVLSPILATLLKLAISRRREYLADASGALLTRYPEGLAEALLKIDNDQHQLATASNATAHMYIENPFKKEGFVSNLFSTHPPVEDRVKALRTMVIDPAPNEKN
jgi:heat shock protein HtpX